MLVALASIAIGAKALPLDQVWHGLFHGAQGTYSDVVVDDRISRTVLGLLVGAALGLSGAVLQALTRNPLGRPRTARHRRGRVRRGRHRHHLLRCHGLSGYVWFAFFGAAAVGALVWFLGGSRGATPVGFTLAGTAVSAALYGYLQAVMIMDDAALGKMRFWTVGSLASATDSTIRQVLPFLVVGTVVALALARPLNAMAMGDDTARALGANLNRHPGAVHGRRHRAVRRRDRRLRADRLRRAHGPARGPLLHRARPAAGSCRTRPCCRPCCSWRRRRGADGRAARGAAGRHRHRGPRRAGLHLSRTTAEDSQL